MGDEEQRLTTREAADRLGVKPETVYAYVSRGQLSSRRDPAGRGSTFDAGEVDALVRKGRREPSAGGDAPQIRTGITLIDTDRYYFRGVDATELARRFHYEEIADWLWTDTLRTGVRFNAPAEALAAARRAVGALPAHSGPTDRLRVAAIAASVADPLRFDLSRDAVLATARTLIPTLVDALPAVGPPRDGDGLLARRLWSRLTARDAGEPGVRALDMALSLLIDHDLAASTLAVRVAASARAHPYAVVSAGLGALEGPLHGAASGLAHRMLTDVLERGSAAAVVADHLRAGRRVPGLGHRLYPGRDPRAEALFTVVAELPGAGPVLAAAREVEATTARHVTLYPNVDLALAALSVTAGMPAEAGETVFAVARTAGWIAHAIEEYAERPLRMRPSGRYNGPRPPRDLP
ncbi:citrate synthase [Streptomyces sp. NPDC056835]|uniref:citrate synthase n=1 Tax=Streptomyces sp. NPDC056835 TaxID=3345956 RepID=UPI0036BEF5D0